MSTPCGDANLLRGLPLRCRCSRGHTTAPSVYGEAPTTKTQRVTRPSMMADCQTPPANTFPAMKRREKAAMSRDGRLTGCSARGLASALCLTVSSPVGGCRNIGRLNRGLAPHQCLEQPAGGASSTSWQGLVEQPANVAVPLPPTPCHWRGKTLRWRTDCRGAAALILLLVSFKPFCDWRACAPFTAHQISLC